MGETARGYGTVAGGAHNLVVPLQTPGYGRGTVALWRHITRWRLSANLWFHASIKVNRTADSHSLLYKDGADSSLYDGLCIIRRFLWQGIRGRL